MFKIKQQGVKQSSPAPTSRRSAATPLPSIHKENLIDGNIFGPSDAPAFKLPFKATLSKFSQGETEFELKQTQPLRSPRQSRRKVQRPWAARPMDLNTDSILPEKVRPSLEKSREMGHERRGSVKESLQKTKELSFYRSQLRAKDELVETVRFVKAASTRQRQPVREKTGPCRIALKKSIFPLNQRQYQHQKLVQLFEKAEDLLSTIPKCEAEERFITVESYSNLVF